MEVGLGGCYTSYRHTYTHLQGYVEDNRHVERQPAASSSKDKPKYGTVMLKVRLASN